MDSSTRQKIHSIVEDKSRIDELIHRQHHLLAQKYNLSLEQFHLLLELDELMLDIPAKKTGISIGDIAKQIGNAQNTISERISRLEIKGLTQRTRDEKDRRVNRVTLTQKGKELLQAISTEVNNTLVFNTMQKLTEDEINQLHRILEKICVCMNKEMAGKDDSKMY